MATDIITPRLNINGSSFEDLTRPRIDALDMINRLIETLRQVTPNGRDYPGDNDACVADRELHYSRISALRALQTALLDECIAIREQNGEY